VFIQQGSFLFLNCFEGRRMKEQPEKNIDEMAMENRENRPVRLKGVRDSLWVTLDPTLSMDQLQTELSKIFQRLKHLAVNARVILDPGEEKGHEALIGRLGSFLKESFNVGMVSPPPTKTFLPAENPRKPQMTASWRYRRSEVLMMSGRVRSGQKVEAKGHLVLMGDVNPGGQVIAGGDVLVMGSLRGSATAGVPDNESAVILSLDFRPTQIQIGGYVAAGLPPGGKNGAEYAHVENGRVVVENYLKANPYGKMPWPEVR
jgi:septum site-determining protein MinC